MFGDYLIIGDCKMYTGHGGTSHEMSITTLGVSRVGAEKSGLKVVPMRKLPANWVGAVNKLYLI